MKTKSLAKLKAVKSKKQFEFSNLIMPYNAEMFYDDY